MKLPRDLSADALSKRLTRYGYSVTRQTGSHLRFTTAQGGEHHITIPAHDSLRVGTLNAILSDVAAHLKKSKEELLQELFG
jgi:predicted RNA binding protein YcfA (HicA-like mRNA interferase family)